jgi:hypothetical protein
VNDAKLENAKHSCKNEDVAPSTEISGLNKHNRGARYNAMNWAPEEINFELKESMAGEVYRRREAAKTWRSKRRAHLHECCDHLKARNIAGKPEHVGERRAASGEIHKTASSAAVLASEGRTRADNGQVSCAPAKFRDGSIGRSLLGHGGITGSLRVGEQ